MQPAESIGCHRRVLERGSGEVFLHRAEMSLNKHGVNDGQFNTQHHNL
jgi:hypothetical protein